MKHTGLLLILILFAALPTLVFAQEDLTETYTSSDGSLSLMYPAGWFLEGFGPFAALSNNEEFSNSGDFETMPSGTVFAFISVGPMSEFAPDLDPSQDITAIGVVESLLEEPDSPELIEGRTQLDIGNDAALIIGQDAGNDILAVIIILDDENGVLFAGGAASGELDMFRDTLIAIASTITYTPPVPGAGAVTVEDGPAATAGTGAVVWQQQRPNTFDDTGFASLGAVDIAADGTIYVADSYYGIRVVDADGNVTGTITNNSITGIDDMALAADGTIWTISSFENTVSHLAADGSLISSFGEIGSGPGQFGDFAPVSFDIGPDGNLYVLDAQTVSDTETATRIEVFDADGNFVREFSTDPDNTGNRSSFAEIAIAPDGNIYMADLFSGVTIFDPQGSIIAEAFAADALGFLSVAAMDFGADGSVYLATNEALLVVDSTGALITRFGTHQPFPDSGDSPPLEPGEFSSVVGIAVAENGDAIIADTNFVHSQIVRISIDEAAASAPLPDTSPEVTPQETEAAPTGATTTDDAGGGSLADAIQSGDAGAPPPPVAASGTELRQWAVAATATSQFSDPSWSAMQASGAPDTDACGDIPTAWASGQPTSDDILTLLFLQEVIPSQINIYQTYNPGAIVRVAYVPVDGSLPVDIPNSADPPGNTTCPGVYTIDITGIDTPVNGVVIYVEQAIVGNWNEIDAVELVGIVP